MWSQCAGLCKHNACMCMCISVCACLWVYIWDWGKINAQNVDEICKWKIRCDLCLSVIITLLFQNKLGDTPLHSAAWKNHAPAVQLLLEKGRKLIFTFAKCTYNVEGHFFSYAKQHFLAIFKDFSTMIELWILLQVQEWT